MTRTSNPAPSVFDPPGAALRSLLAGRDSESLPNIPPLEARVGVRLHEASSQPDWGVEIAARIVDNQDHIATSLGEMATPGFTVWDARGFYRASDGLTLIAGVENFGNRLYQEHLDPHGRSYSFPMVTGTSGRVFRPGANFYFVTEFTY